MRIYEIIMYHIRFSVQSIYTTVVAHSLAEAYLLASLLSCASL